MKTLLLILTLLIAGCQTTAGYKNKVEVYHGQPVAVLLQNWGAPNRAIEHKGLQYLTYHRSQHFQGMSGGHGFGITESCKTTFVVSDGIVISHSFVGKLCRG